MIHKPLCTFAQCMSFGMRAILVSSGLRGCHSFCILNRKTECHSLVTFLCCLTIYTKYLFLIRKSTCSVTSINVGRRALIAPFTRGGWELILSSSSVSTCIVLNWISGLMCSLNLPVLTLPIYHYVIMFNQKITWSKF